MGNLTKGIASGSLHDIGCIFLRHRRPLYYTAMLLVMLDKQNGMLTTSSMTRRTLTRLVHYQQADDASDQRALNTPDCTDGMW